MKIVIFYHCLFHIEGRPLTAAVPIIQSQITALRDSGLMEAANEFHVGLNGGQESLSLAESVFPMKAEVTYHGLACRNELRTLLLLEQFIRERDGDWLVLWHHAKGASHPVGHDLSTRWRLCMQRHLVTNWRRCVSDLEKAESVGCHWMEPPATPPAQYIWAGNFWWARNSFLKTLPSVMERDRIKVSGIDSLESRYEAEVWIGNGSRPPTHIDYHPNWNPSKIATCSP